MGEFDHTAFVATPDATAVHAMLRRLFRESGRTLIDRPPPRQPVFPDPMQYGTGATSARWAAAVLPGRRWTIVKTAPLELLCEPVDGVPRLAVLARELRCDAFQLNLYDGDSLVLVEANAEGAFHISGMNLSIGPVPFHGFELARPDLPARFRLIDVPDAVIEALANRHVPDASRGIRELLHGDAEAASNLVQVSTLIPSRPPDGHPVVYAERAATRPPRPPLELGLAIERASGATRYRLRFAGERELWIHDGAGTTIAPRSSAEAAPIIDELARWLGGAVTRRGAKVPSGVQLFGELDARGAATLSLQARRRSGVLPIGLELDEVRGRAKLYEIDPTIADELLETVAGAWLAEADPPQCLITHLEQVPVPPFRTAEVVAADDGFAIACGQDAHTVVWRWRAGEPPQLVAEVPGSLEQLGRGPGPGAVTLRVGHGEMGHGIEDERDLHVIDVVSGERRLLVHRRAYAGSFAWSPDGQRLALSMSRELSLAERKRYADAARTGRAPLGASARYFIELFDPSGERIGRSPDHVELRDPQWSGDAIFCERVDPAGATSYVTWQPDTDHVASVEAWREPTPGSPARVIAGDHERSWIERSGVRHPISAIRPPPWSEPLTWLDAATCVLGDRLTPTFTVDVGVAVNVRTGGIVQVLPSSGAMPVAASLDGTIVASRDGFALWWGRRGTALRR